MRRVISCTRDLFLQNPECLELWELIAEAEKMLNLYQYEKGLELIHRANQGCKDFIAMEREEEEFISAQTFLQMHWKTIVLEIIGLIIAILLLLYYFRRRRFARAF